LAFEGKKGSKYFPVLKLKSFLPAFDTQQKRVEKPSPSKHLQEESFVLRPI